MCSTREARIARIGAAIDEVAAAARAAAHPSAPERAGATEPTRAPERATATEPTGAAGHADVTELAARLADVWAMLAELDPALAARLRSYFPDTE
jgi:hypothetical protein